MKVLKLILNSEEIRVRTIYELQTSMCLHTIIQYRNVASIVHGTLKLSLLQWDTILWSLNDL